MFNETTFGTVDFNGGTSGRGLTIFGTSFYRWLLVSGVALISKNILARLGRHLLSAHEGRDGKRQPVRKS